MVRYLVFTLAFTDGFILFLFSFNLLILLILALINRHNCSYEHQQEKENSRIDDKNLPKVTIQIPLFNEKYVAARAIAGVCRVNYPKEKLQIQILDDSVDETIIISRHETEKYRKLGIDIQVIHRKARIGFKGGALRNGLEQASGEFVAVFDADFVPEKEMLRKIIPFFVKDESLGMIQTRWGHLNTGFSPLTRAEAILIDCHFSIDQTARGGSSLFMNFNGTAGVWRSSCILDAGNWQDDTVTEDLDLSYRAELRGWKMRYFQDIVSPGELPALMDAYKIQYRELLP